MQHVRCVSVVEVSGQACLWCLKPLGLGGSGLWDGVVFWFGFGQGVNKSGEEALVMYRPADNISGSRDLSAKPNAFCDLGLTHAQILTHADILPCHSS